MNALAAGKNSAFVPIAMKEATRARLGWCAYALLVLGCTAGTSEALGESNDQLAEAPCNTFAPPLVIGSQNIGGAKWTSCSIVVNQHVTIPTTLTIARGATVTLSGQSHEPTNLRVEGKLIANNVSFRTRAPGASVEIAGSRNELVNVTLYDSVHLLLRNSSDNRIENLYAVPSEGGGSSLSFQGGQRNVVVGAFAHRLKNAFVTASFGAEVAIEDSEITASTPIAVGILAAKGARVTLRRSIVSGFATGIQSSESFLVVDDSAIVGNRAAAIRVPQATSGDHCPLIRHSLIADNGAGVDLGVQARPAATECVDVGERTALLAPRIASALARLTQ
jgi:hypothetical protein